MKTREPDIRVLEAAPPAAACCAPAASKAEGLRGRFVSFGGPLLWTAALGAIALIALLPIVAGGLPLPGAGRLWAERLWGEAGRNAGFVLRAFWNILPYFAVSVAASAWANVSGLSSRIKTVFERRQALAISGAALVGATVPLCSCGVIPLIAGLLSAGVPLGPVMAFWISSPLMSPEKFILTAGVLGSDYAAARLVAALGLGAAAGYLTWFLARRGLLNGQLRALAAPEEGGCGCGEAQGAAGEKEEEKNGGAAGGPPPGRLAAFAREGWSTTLFLGKWLAIAFLLEALIVHYLDPAWIGALLGGDNPWAIPLATAIGIPLYTSGVAAIPITEGLLASGMSSGAALAFLVAGPVTTVPAMVAVWALVRPRTFWVYLGTGVAGSLAAGYLFQIWTA